MGWGVHDYPGPPPEKPLPVCPECHEECYTYYRNRAGEIIGCENCIDAIDAIFYIEDLERGEQ